MQSIFKITTLCISLGLLILAGCKPKDATPTAKLFLHMHTNIDTNEVEEDSVYPNAMGRNLKFSRAQFYISNIKLTKTDGSTVPVSGTILMTWGVEDYPVSGTIPVGTYKRITFDVGVASGDNHTDVPSHTGTDVLAAQTPSMHFGSNSDGYIFMAFEGIVDNSVSGTGTPNTAFSYHIGTDALRQTVTMSDHSVTPYNETWNATADGTIYVHMIADYGVLVHNVDMKTNVSTNTTDNLPLATTLSGNISSMFSYEE